MEQKRIFRTAFVGFNKDDVNRFIGGLSRHIDECIADAKAFEARASIAENKLLELQQQYDGKIKENAELADKYNASMDSASSLRERSHQLIEEKIKIGREADKYKSLYDEMEIMIPELKSKAKKYEQNSMHIADAMISAREEADQIIENAIATAAGVRQKLKDETAKIAQEIEKVTFEYSEIQQGVNRYTEQMRTMVEAIFVELDGSQIRMKELEEYTSKLPINKMEFYSNKEKHE